MTAAISASSDRRARTFFSNRPPAPWAAAILVDETICRQVVIDDLELKHHVHPIMVAQFYTIRSSGTLSASAIFFKALVVPFRRPLSRSEM